MDRTAISYVNYLRNQVYINGIDDSYKGQYAGVVYDITTDVQSLKNYLGVDSTMQRASFESYSDLTDYYLEIDDSWFLKDQTVITVTDIYFSDMSDMTRYDGSMMLFSLNNLINDYTMQDSSAILHFKFRINHYPDITDHQVFTFPLFVKPNMDWIGNDLIIQYDINFVNVNFFTNHSLLMTLKEYIQSNYVNQLASNMYLNFLGWNHINLVDYREMIRTMILNNLSNAIGKEWNSVNHDVQKWYYQDATTMVKIVTSVDVNKIISLFTGIITDFYSNHVDWTIDPFAGFVTDQDIYQVVWSKNRVAFTGDDFYDKLNINFLRFVLVRNNIYNWKFTLLQDGTEFQTDYIKFRVKNIIPNQTYDFSFSVNGFEVDLTTDHTSDLPLKVDILEYSNNLIWTNPIPYSKWINQYYFNGFTLHFKGNKATNDYGFNTLRLFISDSLSEENKNILYTYCFAPQEVISTQIAKVDFQPRYVDVTNTFNVQKLLPLNDDFTDYQDLSARFDATSPDDWMWVMVPVTYELIYSKDVPVQITIDTTDSTGNLLPHFQFLEWDVTERHLTISPTLTVDEMNSTFMVMFRYKFNRNVTYTDEIIQKLNGILHARIVSDNVDTTDVNYFQEFMDINFVTTRFKIRKTSHTPIQAQSYNEKSVSKFSPPFSSKTLLTVDSKHHQRVLSDETSGVPVEDFCNFGMACSTQLMDLKYEINRLCTIKSVPTTIKLMSMQSFSIAETKIQLFKYDPAAGKPISWWTSIIGNLKEMNNFAKDAIWKTIIDKFNGWVVNDLFNWYMSHIDNDIMMTYLPDPSLCHYSTSYKSEFIDDVLASDNSYNSWSLAKWAFKKYGLDYTSDNSYNLEDMAKYESKMPIQDNQEGSTTYHVFDGLQKHTFSLDINFATSEVYNIANLQSFIFEAFVKKYFPSYMPKKWKYTKYGDVGVIMTDGTYAFGDNFRLGVFGGNATLVGRDCSAFKILPDSKTQPQKLSDWFCHNYKIDYTTNTGEYVSLTPYEIANVYYSDEHDATAAVRAMSNSLFGIIAGALRNQTVKVKRIYSADLTASLDILTDDVFAIHLSPSNISPLYSNFRITDIKLAYDQGTVSVSELFNRTELTSKRFQTSEVMGTGIDIMCKYLNHSFSEVPLAVMVYYVDEYNYEKTVSVNIVLHSKLQTFVQSQTSALLTSGVDIMKALWLLSVFDQNAQVIQDTQAALKAGVDGVMGNTGSEAEGAVIGDAAKQFQAGFFAIKKQYYGIFGKYLSKNTLESFYSNYIEPCMYSTPHFTWTASVSLFVQPENVEMLDQSDVNRQVAQDVVNYLCKADYKANSGWGNKRQGGDYDPCMDYKEIMDTYYKQYHDRRGYDINLILVPDTTYFISLKTYLVFEWTLTADEKAMPTLSGFLSGIGGGNETQCMVNMQQFLTMARMFPNYEDLLRGILRDMYISNNIPSYGRVPSAEHPITIQQYLPNQYQADYNTFIESANGYYVEFEKSSKAEFGLVVPFEKMVLAIDSTSTGLFDCNYIHFGNADWRNEFGYSDDMRGWNISVRKWLDKTRVNIDIPSVIPKKYIDVVVKPLFLMR